MDIMRDTDAVFASGALSVQVTIRPGQPDQRQVPAFFDESYLAALADELGGLASMVPVTVPVLTCRAADVADVWVSGQKTPLAVAARPEIGVQGGEYRVTKVRPAGPGLKILELEELA